MLVAPGTPIPKSCDRSRLNSRAKRARQVMALGLMSRAENCPPPTPDSSLPLPVQTQMAQAFQPGAIALAQTSSLTPSVTAQGGAGASIGGFSDAPNIVPMNTTPEMAIAGNPQAQRARRRRSSNNPQSQGVNWGGLPTIQAGGRCSPSGASFLDTVKANPWAALFIASGLSVIVYSVAKK